MTQARTQRRVEAIVASEEARDGAGVRLRRAIGMPALQEVGPFLLLDEFQSEDPDAYIAGFPPHPHRGFETVTYMLFGQMHHRDSTGGEGAITSGDVQWMTAGSGIIHSEMPAQTSGLMWGFQLWVNLPSSQKMRDPEYVELKKTSIPEVALTGVLVRVIAGSFGDATGPAPARSTEPLYLDVRLEPGGIFELPVPDGHDSFIYVYDGELMVGPSGAQTVVPTKSTAQLTRAGVVSVSTSRGASFLLVAGKPLNEPVARSGPFVMNSDSELRVAMADYHAGRLVKT